MTRLLVIGMDGADLAVVKPFADAGRLPNLARLMAEGLCGPLRSTYPPMSPPAWTTFMTGVNPGKHGIFDFTVRRPGSYEVEFTNARFRRAPTVWRLLSDAGRRVCVLSVPITFPPERLNGIQVSGIDTPGVTGGLAEPSAIHPPELHAELTETLGGYLISPNLKGIENRPPEEYVAAAFRTIDRKMTAARYLFQKEPWDCFMITIGETDGISHRLWHYHDRLCPMGDPVSRSFSGPDPLLRIYERIDDHIGALLALAGAETTVFVMSDHGHAGNGTRAVYLNRWLCQQGLLRFQTGLLRRLTGELLRAAKRAGTRNLIPLRYRKRLFRRTPLAGMVESYLRFAGVDWSRTVAYSEETPYYPTVWLNVKGREPRGIVPPAEREQVLSELARRLESWLDPATGRPLIRKAHRREDLYEGAERDRFPDLVPEWNLDGDCSYHFRTSRSGAGDAVAELSPEERARAKSGDHREMGLLIVRGPHLPHAGALGEATLADLAPTFLHLLGLPVPEHMDGRVLTEALDPEWLRAHPIRRESRPPDRPPADGPGRYSPEDEEAIRNRLRGLGYIE